MRGADEGDPTPEAGAPRGARPPANDLARLRATSADETVRDPAGALTLAEGRGAGEPTALRTLAAARYSIGRARGGGAGRASRDRAREAGGRRPVNAAGPAVQRAVYEQALSGAG